MTARTLSILFLMILPAFTAAASTIVIYGASGEIGAKIVTEALARDHDVIGVSRHPASLSTVSPKFTAVGGDVTDLDSMLGIITDADVVVISVNGNGPDNAPDNAITNLAALTFIQAAERLGESSPRVIQVGGGSTLREGSTLRLENMDFEEGTAVHGRMWGHWRALENYRTAVDVKWTVVTPPPGALVAGERTGQYRLGSNEVLVNESGDSTVTEEDLAVAIIDEVENPQSIGLRITIGPY